ncbi:hypothetical protein CYMTET_45223 [Cymbomonas tetramitiformis]|uniref:Uncharacterized protein n=1 Tax=Cymbomonas tetramitiformis TaxID=36881 RepID=A0AAE0BYL9_9CHLO|nr:hypothetical protein CYMTET_45223 [Cymbomonas tetramitiformis]|eukprot:gene26236-32152_t
MRAPSSHNDGRVLKFCDHPSIPLGEWRQILMNCVWESEGGLDDDPGEPTAEETRLLGEEADVVSVLRAYRHELMVARPILMTILRAARDADASVDAPNIDDALLAVLGEEDRTNHDLAIMFMEAIDRSHPAYLALLCVGGRGWKRHSE